MGATSPPIGSFAEVWATSVVEHGARPFLCFESSDGTVTEWGYAEFDELVAWTAARFVACGVSADRGVHLVLRNSPAFVVAWLAALRLGSHIIPSDPMATAPELAEHLSRTQPAVAVVAASRSGTYADAMNCPDGAQTVGIVVIAVDEDDTTMSPLAGQAGSNGPLAPVHRWPQPALTDRAAVMFTSGTTGRPKGVVVTQANYAFAGRTMAAAAGLGPLDRQLVVLPLFHANAQYYSFASAISVGASVALMHTFSASRFVEQAAVHGATHASLFAGPMRMILARGAPRSAGAPPMQLRHCWYAQNITTDQYETLAAWLDCRPRQLYGMTETIPAVLTDVASDPRPDALGVVTPGCEVEVHDANGARCSPGEVGEIVVGGEPGLELFAEYLDDPDTTEASFRGRWFRTGDRAHVDPADGRFVFDGRRADVLKVAGENVSVVEVEAAIAAHPDVFDVVVVGAPDPIRDEVPVAFVVPTAVVLAGGDERHRQLADDLAAWCESRMVKSKRPREHRIVDELPRTSVGKVRKFLLSELAEKPTAEPSASRPVDTSFTESPADSALTSSDQETPT